MFAIGCREWIQRLSADSNLVEMMSKAGPTQMFANGVLCLRGLITKGVLKELENVFAISHVLLAILYTLHHDDGSGGWCGSNWDPRRWQRTVENEIDAELFSDARDQWNVS